MFLRHLTSLASYTVLTALLIAPSVRAEFAPVPGGFAPGFGPGVPGVVPIGVGGQRNPDGSKERQAERDADQRKAQIDEQMKKGVRELERVQKDLKETRDALIGFPESYEKDAKAKWMPKPPPKGVTLTPTCCSQEEKNASLLTYSLDREGFSFKNFGINFKEYPKVFEAKMEIWRRASAANGIPENGSPYVLGSAEQARNADDSADPKTATFKWYNDFQRKLVNLISSGNPDKPGPGAENTRNPFDDVTRMFALGTLPERLVFDEADDNPFKVDGPEIVNGAMNGLFQSIYQYKMRRYLVDQDKAVAASKALSDVIAGNNDAHNVEVIQTAVRAKLPNLPFQETAFEMTKSIAADATFNAEQSKKLNDLLAKESQLDGDAKKLQDDLDNLAQQRANVKPQNPNGNNNGPGGGFPMMGGMPGGGSPSSSGDNKGNSGSGENNGGVTGPGESPNGDFGEGRPDDPTPNYAGPTPSGPSGDRPDLTPAPLTGDFFNNTYPGRGQALSYQDRNPYNPNARGPREGGTAGSPINAGNQANGGGGGGGGKSGGSGGQPGMAAAAKGGGGAGGNDGVFNFPSDGDGGRVPYVFSKAVEYGAPSADGGSSNGEGETVAKAGGLDSVKIDAAAGQPIAMQGQGKAGQGGKVSHGLGLMAFVGSFGPKCYNPREAKDLALCANKRKYIDSVQSDKAAENDSRSSSPQMVAAKPVETASRDLSSTRNATVIQ